MSKFNQALINVISKATKEYEIIAKNDPVIESIDDGTVRGDYLDVIINTQNQEKKELWDKLYELQEQRKEKGHNSIFIEDNELTPDRKQLLILMYENRKLALEEEDEKDKMDLIEQHEDTILELEFHEDLDKQIKQYGEALQFLQEQLKQTTSDLRSEKKVLTECLDIYDALEAKQKELAEMANVETYPNQLRDEQAMLESAFKQDRDDLIDFVDEYFPATPVDNAGPLGDVCELKLVLEDLMNQAVTTPDNPYIQLVPGTYWSPYIQTLAKAGILKYHSKDTSLVRLEDFKL